MFRAKQMLERLEHVNGAASVSLFASLVRFFTNGFTASVGVVRGLIGSYYPPSMVHAITVYRARPLHNKSFSRARLVKSDFRNWRSIQRIFIVQFPPCRRERE